VIKHLEQNLKMAKSSMGLDTALQAIFVLGIAVGVTQGVIAAGNFTGITATVIAYAPLIIVAGFLYMVAKSSGVMGK
jgi:hypothetical protein